MAIILTDNAIKEIKRIYEDKKLDVEKVFLKIGVKGGGCHGFTYILDIVDNKNETDEIFENDGVKVICDVKSYLYLNGTKIDFKNELMLRGFVFDNPNSTSTCGCGKSFSP
jgi:iron-sulfur cluster assembly protein